MNFRTFNSYSEFFYLISTFKYGKLVCLPSKFNEIVGKGRSLLHFLAPRQDFYKKKYIYTLLKKFTFSSGTGNFSPSQTLPELLSPMRHNALRDRRE